MENNRYWQIFNAFDKIEQNIAELLVGNRDIFRLLKWEDWKENPYQKDVSDADIVNMITEYTDKHEINTGCRIFFEPYVTEVETVQRSHIRIFPVEVRPNDIYEAEIFIDVNVIVNLAVNKFKGGRRINALTGEIIKALQGKEIGMIHRLELIEHSIRMTQFKADYWGYSFMFRTGVACNGL
jgi:hypothetical protein